MSIQYDYIEEILPKDIFFITTQELEDLYPELYSRRSVNTSSQRKKVLSA